MYDMCITPVLNPKTVKYFVINVLNATRFFKVRAGSRASADQKVRYRLQPHINFMITIH